MHPADLEELLVGARLEPCEAIECVARSRESGARELVTALRPIANASEAAQHAPRPAKIEDVNAAIQRAREAHRGRETAARARKRGTR